MPLDVLDHHDRVVNHQSSRKGDPEQRQRIDREAEDLDECESANQRYRDSDCRDDGGPPIQQEKENHDDDDQDGFFERGHDLPHRIAHDCCRIKRDDVLDARREGLGQFNQFSFRSLIHLKRVGVGQLLYANSNCFVPAVEKVRVIALCANLSASDVFELHDPVFRVLDDDVLEFPEDRKAVL